MRIDEFNSANAADAAVAADGNGTKMCFSSTRHYPLSKFSKDVKVWQQQFMGEKY